jgi:hypothetical protein
MHVMARSGAAGLRGLVQVGPGRIVVSRQGTEYDSESGTK